ncbi:DUF916 domain-containing protein [Enterococcus mundtii]|uniref:DUF916 domain-containing protein n=1 Tax=Enterococcus mundtii TaxID=53346 RepID=UPI001F03EB6D|nr:DUF916 domain-containing protein [Enterococcus mundtii]
MIHKQTIQKSLWLLIVLFFFLPHPTVQAEEAGLNTYVTPLFPESQVDESKGYYELLLSPGQKETLRLEVGNSSSEPINVQLTPHTAYTNTLGNVEYGKDAKEADPTLIHSLDELMTPSEVITVAGNETKVIEIPLQMPKDAFEGYLAGGLRITEVKEEEGSDVPGLRSNHSYFYVLLVTGSVTDFCDAAFLERIMTNDTQTNDAKKSMVAYSGALLFLATSDGPGRRSWFKYVRYPSFSREPSG